LWGRVAVVEQMEDLVAVVVSFEKAPLASPQEHL
jgi:hypothetical protein